MAAALPFIQAGGAALGGAAQLNQKQAQGSAPQYQFQPAPMQNINENLQGQRPDFVQPPQYYVPQAGGSGADLNLMDLFSKFSGRGGF